jgi:ribosomal protein S18 acetylase RimI-like enzyme
MIYDDAYNYIASGDLVEQLDSLMFEKIYVEPSYRGQGYGKKIVELLLEQCFKSKIKNVYLKVHYDNINAINIYEKYDFIYDSMDNQYIWMKLNK